MTFDEIVETANCDKKDRLNIDKIRSQRDLCGMIRAGVLFHGLQMSDAESNFVIRCNRSMTPVNDQCLSVLAKLSERI